MSIAGQKLTLKRWLVFITTLQSAILKAGLEEKEQGKEPKANGIELLRSMGSRMKRKPWLTGIIRLIICNRSLMRESRSCILSPKMTPSCPRRKTHMS